MSRYENQELLWKEKQSTLTKTKISLIGTGSLAIEVAKSLACLGFGIIRIIDDKKIDDSLSNRCFLFRDKKGMFCAEVVKNLLQDINPEIIIETETSNLMNNNLYNIINTPQLIIDCSNNLDLQIKIAQFAQEWLLSFIIATIQNNFGQIVINNSDSKGNLIDFTKILKLTSDDSSYNPIVESIIANIIADCARKTCFSIGINEYDNLQSGRIDIDITKINQRFSFTPLNILLNSNSNPPSNETYEDEEIDLELSLPFKMKSLKKKHIVMVGAGGIGTDVGKILAQLKIPRLTIVDFDRIELANLNRQYFYTKNVGDFKLKIIAEKLKLISPKIEIEEMDDKLDETNINKIQKPDVIIDATDNFEIRCLLNQYARKNNIPLIYAASGGTSGQVQVYLPNTNGCIDCQLDIEKKMIEFNSQRPPGCHNVREPSIVTINGVIGAVAAECAYRIIAELPIFKGGLRFNPLIFSNQFGFYPYNKKCKHEQVI